MTAQSFIIESSTKPARYQMTQVNLAVVFEAVDNVANDSATTVCGHRCIEVNGAMRTIRARKGSVNGTFERLRTRLAKWRHDADHLCFATIPHTTPHPD